ncbi:MAG: hypothetical protein Tsb005_00190 [Gammaproteobacteria bacterium]
MPSRRTASGYFNSISHNKHFNRFAYGSLGLILLLALGGIGLSLFLAITAPISLPIALSLLLISIGFIAPALPDFLERVTRRYSRSSFARRWSFTQDSRWLKTNEYKLRNGLVLLLNFTTIAIGIFFIVTGNPLGLPILLMGLGGLLWQVPNLAPSYFEKRRFLKYLIRIIGGSLWIAGAILIIGPALNVLSTLNFGTLWQTKLSAATASWNIKTQALTQFISHSAKVAWTWSITKILLISTVFSGLGEIFGDKVFAVLKFAGVYLTDEVENTHSHRKQIKLLKLALLITGACLVAGIIITALAATGIAAPLLTLGISLTIFAVGGTISTIAKMHKDNLPGKLYTTLKWLGAGLLFASGLFVGLAAGLHIAPSHLAVNGVVKYCAEAVAGFGMGTAWQIVKDQVLATAKACFQKITGRSQTGRYNRLDRDSSNSDNSHCFTSSFNGISSFFGSMKNSAVQPNKNTKATTTFSSSKSSSSCLNFWNKKPKPHSRATRRSATNKNNSMLNKAWNLFKCGPCRSTQQVKQKPYTELRTMKTIM